MAAGAGKELTFSGDFSPGIIPDLGQLLTVLSASGGHKGKLVDAIRDEYFRDTAAKLKNPKERRKQQNTRAYNVILSLVAYGLLERESYTLTPLGRDLLSAPSSDERAERFAKHILAKIHRDLRSKSKAVKGIALELLALRMVMDLGLTPTGFRLRSADTGGAEVDLTAEGAHLLFSRWTFQCKNMSKVPLSDLAKEIGMATLLKAHVVVMVATGDFAGTVVARQVAQTTPLQVVLVAGEVVGRYLESGDRSIGVLMEFFRKTAANTMRLKEPQRSDVQAEVNPTAAPMDG